jgi:hypothetical protein
MGLLPFIGKRWQGGSSKGKKEAQDGKTGGWGFCINEVLNRTNTNW